MKLLFLSIFIFNFSLFANELSYKRIYITYTFEKKHVDSIYNILKKVNIQIYIDKEKNKFTIYSKKYFNDDAKIYTDLKTIKTKFKNAKIILHKEIMKDEQKVDKKDNFIFNLSLGSSKIKNTPNYDFTQQYKLNYEAELTYLFTKNTSFSFTYLDSSQNLMKLDNILTTINYTFHPSQNFFILFGLEAGYSILEFYNDQNSKQSSSTLMGVKSKIGYSITNNIDLFIKYNALYFEHIVYVESSSINIKFNYINSLLVGLGVRF